MFEARLLQGSLLKKLVDAIKDLVSDANFDLSSAGIALQAMDTSHVCLVSLLLRSDGFEHFRCDKAMSMGLHMANLYKILKCAGNDDIISLRANEDTSDTVTLMCESPSGDRIADFELKLMDIETEHLGIPDTEYSVTVRMASSQYAHICRDLASIGDTVVVSASKDGVRFSTSGDVGVATVTLRQGGQGGQGDGSDGVAIDLKEPVTLSFALRYLNSFSKSAPLASHVTLSMTRDLPLVVEFAMSDMGHLRFYLAPKIEEEGEEGGEGGGGEGGEENVG